MTRSLISGREGMNLPPCLRDEPTIEIALRDGDVIKTYPAFHWPAHVAIADELLESINAGNAPHGCASAGDGFVRFTMSDGDTALYGQATCDEHFDGAVACTHFDRLQPDYS